MTQSSLAHVWWPIPLGPQVTHWEQRTWMIKWPLLDCSEPPPRQRYKLSLLSGPITPEPCFITLARPTHGFPELLVTDWDIKLLGCCMFCLDYHNFHINTAGVQTNQPRPEKLCFLGINLSVILTHSSRGEWESSLEILWPYIMFSG